MTEMVFVLFLVMADNKGNRVSFPVNTFHESEECEDIGWYASENMRNFLKTKKVEVTFNCVEKKAE